MHRLPLTLSLLLCLSLLILWARSLTTTDWLSFSKATPASGLYARTEWTAMSGPGFVVFLKKRTVPVDAPSAIWLENLDKKTGLGWQFGPVASYDFKPSLLLTGWGRLGMPSGQSQNYRVTSQWKSLEVPMWLLLLIASLPVQPLIWRVLRRLRARRHSASSPPDPVET